MGNGASVENDGSGSQPGSRPGSRPNSQPGSARNTPNMSRRNSTATNVSSATWKSAFKQGKPGDTNLRKLRGCALGGFILTESNK